jgi:hypothetical protein
MVSHSLKLWQKMPESLLKIKFKSWDRLNFDVKILILELAEKQNFKCAHCAQGYHLEIEHDHEPQHGRGDQYTIYNIRGLTCRRCNWHLRLYEKNKIGEFWGWEEAESSISENEYERYIYEYECRVEPLLDVLLKERLGIHNYWRRRSLLTKVDDWKEGWRGNSWRQAFKEIKDKKYGQIRNPEQFLETLIALMKFVSEEIKKDPNYQPPEKFFELMERTRPIIDAIKASSMESKINNSDPTPALRADPPLLGEG